MSIHIIMAQKTKKKAFYLSSAVIIAIISIFLFNYPPQSVNAADESVSCNSTTLDQTALDALAGDAVTFTDGGDGICIFTGTLGAASVTVNADVTLTHNAEDEDGLSITTADYFLLNGNIDVEGKGCSGGENGSTDGHGPDTSTGVCAQTTSGYGKSGDSGGAHAGSGGEGHYGGAVQLTTYGDSNNSSLLGSGGGATSNPNTYGGNGGGLIALTIGGTLTVNGSINADGQDGYGTANRGGGGSGGSIKVTTTTLAGSGAISVDGGNGNTNYSGGGGAGRAAIYYNDASGFTLTNITAAKGLKSSGTTGNAEDGTVGSIFILDQDSDILTTTTGLELQDGDDYTKSEITFLDGAQIWCDSFATLNIGATGTLAMDDNTWTCDSVDTINMSAGTWTTSGTSTMSFNKAGSQVDWDISNNLTLNNLTYNGGYAGITSASGGLLTLDNPIDINLVNTDIISSVDLDATNLTLDASSSVSAKGTGCAGGITSSTNGYGPNTSTGICTQGESGYGKGNDGGGAHAGAGGRGNYGDATQLTTYGSADNPSLFGSGGGSNANPNNYGGYGGGKVFIDVTDTLSVAGDINADGQDGYGSGSRSGGGSGGALKITTGTLSGAGTISVDGGNGNTDYSGGAGGGRAYVGYAVNDSFNLSNITSTKGLKSSGTPGSAVDGGDGSVSTLAYTAPTQPTLSPSDTSRNMALTSSAYSSNGASHTSTDWYVCTDAACDASSLVWYSEDDASNLEAVTVNTTNGTFAGTLAGETKLAPATSHQIKVRHTNAAGDSTWSSFTGQSTQANNVPSAPTNVAPADATTDQSKTPTLTSSIYSDSDSDDHGDSTWEIYESSDCTGDKAWRSLDDSSNLESIDTSAAGTFLDDYATPGELKGHTEYSWKARHDDEYSGQSSDSSCTKFTTLNTTPTANAGADQTATEGDDVTLSGSSTDLDWNDTVTETWIESLDSSDACTLSGTTATTSDKETSYTCQFQVTADDGQGTTDTDTMTLTVTADNDAPTMGTLADVVVDEEQALLIAISSADTDSSSLTLSASTLPTGAVFTDNEDTTGNMQWTPTSDQSGAYAVTFSVSDGTTAVTQNITITVNDTVQDEEEEEPVNTIEDIGLVSGTESGPGIVTLYDNDNVELCSVRAWNEGGSVPFAVRFLDTTYVAVVKNKVGTTIHLYDLNCNIIEKKRLSPKLHPRNIVTRNFLGKTTSQEIGLTSRRGSTVYGKIFRYNPNKDKWYLLRQKTFRPVPTGYNLKKTKKGNILIKKNNKTLHKWEI